MNLTTTQKIMLQRATPQDLYNIREAIDLMFQVPEGWQVRKTADRDEKTLSLEEIELQWNIDPVEGKVYNKAGKELKSQSNGRVLLTYYQDDLQHSILRSHLVWLKVNRTWPSPCLCIDHINQDKLDDRISNLREVSYSKNMENVTSKKLKLDAYGNLLPRGIAQRGHQYQFRFELTSSFLTRTTSNIGTCIYISSYSLEETYAYQVLKMESLDADDFLRKLQLEPEDIQRINDFRVGINPATGYTVRPISVKPTFKQEFNECLELYSELFSKTSPTIH